MAALDLNTAIWQDPNFGGALTYINPATGKREVMGAPGGNAGFQQPIDTADGAPMWSNPDTGFLSANPTYQPITFGAPAGPDWLDKTLGGPLDMVGEALADTPILMLAPAAIGAAAGAMGAGAGAAGAGAAEGALMGGAFDMGGMAGLEAGFGIGGAGMEGALAGGTDFLSGGVGDNFLMGEAGADFLGGADAFGNYDMGYGAGGTEAGVPAGEGGFQLDLSNVPTSMPGGSGSSTPGYESPDIPNDYNIKNYPGAPTAPPGMWERIINGTATMDDWMKLLGTGGSTLLGLLGSNNQADAQRDLAQQFMNFGAPSRARFEQLNADPAAWFNGPVAKETLEQVLRRLSVGGNPANNPYKQGLAMQALLGAYNTERGQQAQWGGLAGFNSAAPGALTAAAGSEGNIYNVLGSGLADLTRVQQPQMTLQQLLAAIGGSATF